MKIRLKAATLLETLLYISIVSIILITISSLYYVLIETRLVNSVRFSVNQNAEYIQQIFASKIKESNNSLNPVKGSDSTNLIISTDNGNYEFFLQNEGIYIRQNTDEPLRLTSSNVRVTSLKFSNLGTAGASDSIKAQFTIRFNNLSGRDQFNYQEEYYVTANSRQ